MAVIGSGLLEDEVLELPMLSRSSTHCTVCATAACALAMACEGVFLRSSWTVANAACVVVTLPELMAVPNAFMSVASGVLADEMALSVDAVIRSSWL